LNQLSPVFDELPEEENFHSWKLNFLWQLRDFGNQLKKHFDLEEFGGYNAELVKLASHLLPKIETIEEEHLKISSDIEHILDVFKGIQRVNSAKLHRVGGKVSDLIHFIRDHEATEHASIQEAYYQDYSVGAKFGSANFLYVLSLDYAIGG
jgi:hypothetical protein